jgi:hypothetical protein
MKKLKLNVDELAIESFESTSDDAAKGTAFAHDSGTGAPYTCEAICTQVGNYTCAQYDTCAWPCAASDVTNCHRCTVHQTEPTYCG